MGRVYSDQYCVRACRSPCQLQWAGTESEVGSAARRIDGRVAWKSVREDIGRLEEAQGGMKSAKWGKV